MLLKRKSGASSTRTNATAPAAIIVVSNDQNGYYKSKWDFAPMSGSNANRLVLTKHNAKWQAIVHPPGGPAAAPRQVEYRDHYADIKAGGGFTIPGNARWRWVATDERIWVGCDVGCCEAIE